MFCPYLAAQMLNCEMFTNYARKFALKHYTHDRKSYDELLPFFQRKMKEDKIPEYKQEEFYKDFLDICDIICCHGVNCGCHEKCSGRITVVREVVENVPF